MVKTTGSLSYLEEFKLDGAANVLERRRHGPNQLPQQHSIMADQLTSITTLRPATPAAGLIANDTYNHFQGSTGEVLASGTVTETVQSGVWQEVARMASQNYFGTDGKLNVHQRYEDETGTGQRWGVWEEYRYDALGRRILTRTQRPNTICNVANCYSSITRFIWDGDQLALELRAPGAPTDNLESTSGSMPRFGTVAYTHGGGIDRPLGLLRSSTVVSPFLVVPHTDWRGLFDRGTNSSGQLFDNRPGEPPIDWPGRDRLSYHDESRNTQPLGSWYGSLIQDMKDESGLAYRRNRYYDPNTGRFVQQDPIGLAGGINLYGFAGGDPVTFTDPFGLCPICYVVFEVGATLYDVGDLAATGISYLRGNASKTELALTAAGAGAGIVGFGGGYGRAGRHLAKESADRLIRDATDNPGNWRAIGAFTEEATGRKARGGVSTQVIMQNQHGDQVVRHILYDKQGRVIEDHFRPMYHPRDVDRR